MPDVSTPARASRPPLVPAALHLWVWAAFLVLTMVVAALFFWGREVDVWANLEEARELRRPIYTEAVYIESIFRTRANTWSNLAYVLVGLYALGLALHDRRRTGPANHVIGHPILSLGFGAACVLLGFASGIFHASLTRWGQQLDVASMYPPLMVLAAMGLGRLWPRFGAGGPPTAPALVAVVAVAGVLFYHYKWQMSAVQVMVTLILLVFAFRCYEFFRKAPMDGRWFHLAFAFLVVGVFFRQIDVAGRFTGPDAWFQGHALWHGFTAASLGCIYLYYRSEAPSPAREDAARPTAT